MTIVGAVSGADMTGNPMRPLFQHSSGSAKSL
jgi:hypothetical protein